MAEAEPKPTKPRGHPLPIRVINRLSALPYERLMILWGIFALLFASLYFILSYLPGHHGSLELEEISNPAVRFLDAVYYSVITATSTGYGDITPSGISRLLAALQSIMSLGIFAVFVTKLVSHKQEISLTQVHKRTFEAMYHNIREGLYVIRNDFDEIINKITHHKRLNDRDWENIATAFKSGQALLQEIPDFYDTEEHLYTIDSCREQLLQEAVHRTMHRLNELLSALNKHGIKWSEHKECVTNLQELIGIFGTISLAWKQRSPYQREEMFSHILDTHASMAETLKCALPEE